MNKQELIEKIADNAGLSKKDASNSVESFIEAITESLKKGEKVAITGFGTFDIKISKARQARNPKTGETIHIPEKKAPKFKVGKAFKEIFA